MEVLTILHKKVDPILLSRTSNLCWHISDKMQQKGPG